MFNCTIKQDRYSVDAKIVIFGKFTQRSHVGGAENAGLETAGMKFGGPNSRAGKCRTGPPNSSPAFSVAPHNAARPSHRCNNVMFLNLSFWQAIFFTYSSSNNIILLQTRNACKRKYFSNYEAAD